MRILIALLFGALLIASETEQIEKKREKDRKGKDKGISDMDMQSGYPVYEEYDDSYAPPPPPPKPSSKPSNNPVFVTETLSKSGQSEPTKQSNSGGNVTTAISNKYITIYPTIEKPRMEGKAQDNKHPYLAMLLGLTMMVMALGHF